MKFTPKISHIFRQGKLSQRLLILIAGFFLLSYLFIANTAPIRDKVLSLFFPKSSTLAAALLKEEAEFSSNQVLIKVKKEHKNKIKEGNAKDTGIPTLNEKLKNLKAIKLQRVAKIGKQSVVDADIFDWYVVTFSGEQGIERAKYNHETKKLEAKDNGAKNVVSRIETLQSDPSISVVEPNFIIASLQTGCETQMVLTLDKTSFTVAAGDTITNTLHVKNNGSATCSKTISATYPGGWTQTLSQSSVSVAPGATVDVPFTMKVGANTVTNSYMHYLWLATYGAGSVGESFQVAGVTPGPTNTPIPTPTLPPGTVCTNTVDARLQNATVTAQPGQTVSNVLLVKNPNPTACGSNTYISSRSYPGGWNIAIQNSMTVSPGETVSVPFTITVPTSASLSTYTYTFTVYNNWADGSGQSQTSGNVVVSLISPTAVPTVTTPTPTPSPTQAPAATPNDPYYSSTGTWGQAYDDMWGMKRIDAAGAWSETTGSQDVVIAVVDSGVDRNHEDLVGNMWVNVLETPGNGIDDDGNGYIDDVNGWDLVSDDNDPMDTLGHGTLVAGVIGAVGNNGKGVVGVNWKTKIMPVRMLGDSNTGTWEDGAAAISYAADMGAKVINNSWGGNYYSKIAQDAAQYAHEKGAVVVASAGNNGSDVILTSPAGNERVIAVGAVDMNDARSFGYWSSNYGVRLDVAGPGVDILSTKATNGSCLGYPMVGSAYCRVPGTSLASPFVSGLAGLLLSKYPTLTNEEVRQVIRNSSTDIGTAGFDAYYGYGRINAANAMRLAATRPLAPLIKSPTGRSTVWGTQTILGSAAGPDFASYTLEAGQSITPSSWTILKTSTTPVNNGSLADVDLNTLPAGQYSFRLTARRVDGVAYQFQTYMVNVGQPTPTPTATPTPHYTPTPTTAPTVAPTAAPSEPRNVAVSPASSTSLAITWLPPLNGPTVGVYNIYRNGTRIVQGNIFNYLDKNLQPSTTYTYVIEPQYLDGSVGPRSNPASGTTMAEATPTNTPSPTNTPTPTVTPTRAPTPTPTPDTSGPAVSITSPATNATVKDTIVIAATVSDPSGVSQVQYYVDDVLVGSQTVAPYSLAWDSRSVANAPHTITVRGYDTLGNTQQVSISITVNNPDTTPPSAPTTLTGSADAYNRVNLRWAASSDNIGVTSYWIIRDGSTIASTSATSYDDRTVQPDTRYAYQVVAVDAAGNNSGVSNTFTVTTPTVPDTIAPSIPANVLATTISSSQINLSWSPSSDNISVVSYEVYRNTILIATVTTTSFGDIGLAASTQYSYTIRARDAAGNVSGSSIIATATTQNPPVPSGAIIGKITAGGKGIVGAKVSTVVNGIVKTTYADASGNYSLGSLFPSTYAVTYSAVGYKSETAQVTVTSGKTTTKNVTLQKGK